MSSESPNAGIRPPEHAGYELFAESDRLTKRLEHIEAILNQVPWKFPATLAIGERERLAFGARTNAKWGLSWHVLPRRGIADRVDAAMGNQAPPEAWETTWVRDCSPEIKAKVAAFLPKLVERIRTEFDRRAAVVKQGHAELDSFELVLSKLAGSGDIGDPFEKLGVVTRRTVHLGDTLAPTKEGE